MNIYCCIIFLLVTRDVNGQGGGLPVPTPQLTTPSLIPAVGDFFPLSPSPWIPTVLTGPEIYKRNMTATMTIWWWQFPSFSFLFSLASSRSIRHHGELSRRWRYNRYLLLFTSCITQNDTHRCRAAMAQSSFFTPILSLCWDEPSRWQCLCAALFPFPISAYLHLMLRGGASIATIPATVHHCCAVTAQLPSWLYFPQGRGCDPRPYPRCAHRRIFILVPMGNIYPHPPH